MALKFFSHLENAGCHSRVGVVSNKNEPQAVARRESWLLDHDRASASWVRSIKDGMLRSLGISVSALAAGGVGGCSSVAGAFGSADARAPGALGLFLLPAGRPRLRLSCPAG